MHAPVEIAIARQHRAADQIGGLEAGRFADVIAVSGDPLADITNMENVVFVMKSGEVIKQQPPADKSCP